MGVSDAFTELGAVLIKFKPGAQAAGFMLDQRCNRQGRRLTLAWPVAAIGLYGAIAVTVQEILRARVGVLFEPWARNPSMLWGPVAMLALSVAAGAIPAWRAFRLSVADGLSPLS